MRSRAGQWVGCFALGLFAAFLVSPASAQLLPNHADADAREILPDLQPVPAIRFLTTTDFPPFNFRDSAGEVVGYNIDLARRICTEIDIACTIQAWPWDQVVSALEDNQGDAVIAGVAMTPETAGAIDFSAIYLALPGRFVTRAEDVDGFDQNALAALKVGVRDGSAHDAFLNQYFPTAARVAFASEGEALAALAASEVKAYFGDAMRAAFWLNDNPACCNFASEPYFRPNQFGEGLAVGVRAGQDKIRHAIDWALVRLKDNGTLDELYLRWFPVGFY
ncbi:MULTISPECIES: transporter substrate-binding domain-containing protein [unclassified Devosia]|uniref:transporter substrate-binding domain-containing protein n=1 Tax=unclassified Devosia TaxID=196773 RepID=UPI00145FCEA4|nr:MULTISPECIES: transporter substrate-binding domain-containing protein [unclassified Devosia]MBJ6988358.1 transporter substrate-binding domain-containing protein [Devosia sp. MC521]QMW63029.1 transporter substrate-binding domain-containing protein [Devosia sp. MC521]